MKRNCGFTLIEMMIVVVIIGILTRIAIVQYRQSVVTSHLVEAPTTLSNFAAQMEQYYQDNHTYANSTTPAQCGVLPPSSPAVKYFTYTCRPCDVGAADPSRAGILGNAACTNSATGTSLGYTIDASSTAATDTGTAGDWDFWSDDQANKVTQTGIASGTTAFGPVTGCWVKTKGATSC